jgi:hypothetical protein
MVVSSTEKRRKAVKRILQIAAILAILVVIAVWGWTDVNMPWSGKF